MIKSAKGNDQFTINSTASFRPVKSINISTGIMLSQHIQRGVDFNSGIQYPYAKLADENNNALSVPYLYRMGYVDTVGAGQLLDWHFKPLNEVRDAQKKDIVRLINLNINAAYRITDWLTAQISGQYSSNINDQKKLYSLSTYFARNLINQFTNLSQTDPNIRNPIPIGGILDLGSSKSVSYNLRAKFDFNKSWGRHTISGLFASDISESNSGNSGGRLYGYNEQIGSFNPNINYNVYYPLYGSDLGSYISTGDIFTENSVNRFVSITTNLNYTYNNRYTIYASARRDAANLFGIATNQKWKPLWSIGLSWDIKQEAFSLPLWVSDLKLKASYGYSGNVNNNSRIGYPTIIYSTLNDGFTGFKKAILNEPPNPNLRWEEVKITNIGVGFSLFRNRVNGSIEAYSKLSKDLIAPVTIPNSNGVESHVINSASLKGHGIEFNLDGTIACKDFSWTPRIGFAYSAMKVAKLNPSYSKILARDFISFNINPSIGQLAYAMASYKWAGLDPLTGDPRGYLDGNVSKDYLKIFNDTVGKQKLHGSSMPLISGMIFNTLNWKKISLAFNIVYKLNYYYRKPALNYEGLFGGESIFGGTGDYDKRWQKPGDENFTSVPSMIYPIPSEVTERSDFYRFSEIHVLRGDHIKLQDVQLQYSLSKKVLPFVNHMNIFCYLNDLNLMIWKKDKSPYDPEFAGGAVSILRPPVSVAFGLNISL